MSKFFVDIKKDIYIPKNSKEFPPQYLCNDEFKERFGFAFNPFKPLFMQRRGINRYEQMKEKNSENGESEGEKETINIFDLSLKQQSQLMGYMKRHSMFLKKVFVHKIQKELILEKDSDGKVFLSVINLISPLLREESRVMCLFLKENSFAYVRDEKLLQFLVDRKLSYFKKVYSLAS